MLCSFGKRAVHVAMENVGVQVAGGHCLPSVISGADWGVPSSFSSCSPCPPALTGAMSPR